jgi:very-short-patch-repair endonuclease
MNKIERIVHDYLLEISENFKYSTILGYFQFDFGIKDKRILIEVDGDYWHGNPAFYNNIGCEGKKILNSIQLKNIKRDLDKNMFAEKNNLKIIRIWESQIKDGSFKEILKNKL